MSGIYMYFAFVIIVIRAEYRITEMSDNLESSIAFFWYINILRKENSESTFYFIFQDANYDSVWN